MSRQASLRRRFVALLVTSILVSALLPVIPAAAATDACPSSVPSTNYRDLTGLSTESIEAINCVTYYGISQGVTSTSFDPWTVVPRWQMALFLTRTAQDMGLPLPSGTDRGFTDLAGVPPSARTAINQLAQLGITEGVTATTFAPFDPVPRWQMALFLTRLYVKAGFALPSGADQGFVDTQTLPNATWRAINQLAQLGISKGVSPGRFDPDGAVLRWQMALFLARELDAAKIRPMTVTIIPSASSSPTSGQITLTLSVKRADGSTVSGQYVDVFVGSLDSSGKCVLDTDASLNGGDAATGSNCKIDTNDPRTNSGGLATVTLSHTNTIEVDTVYAWVGANNATFDIDDRPLYAMTQIQWTAPVAKLDIADMTARYGTQTTISAALLGSSNQPVPLSGQKIVFRVTRSGSQIISQTATTGSNGVASITYTGPADPTVGDDPVKTDTVTAFWDRDGDGVDDGAAEFDDTATVTWDDELPRADRTALTQSTVASLAGAKVTISLRVTDKFGVGYPNARITFAVSGANGATIVADTDSSGSAQVSYTPGVVGVDTIDARVDFDRNGTIDSGDIDYGAVTDLTHHVVQLAPNLTDGVHSFDVLRVDVDANAIDVVEIGTANRYRLLYDTTNDLFNVDGKAVQIGVFESELSKLALPALDGAGGVQLRTNTYTTSTSGSSTFLLETS